MKKILSFIFSVFMVAAAWGSKAESLPATISQPDGTMLTVLLHGDEYSHWYTTMDGVLLVQQGNAYYVAQISGDGSLVASSQLAHNALMRTQQESNVALSQDRQRFYYHANEIRSAQVRRTPLKKDPTYFPHTGSPRALVILVQFADTAFTLQDPKASFEQYLNADGFPKDVVEGYRNESRNYKSVKSYFSDMSNGMFTPQFDIVGPVTLSQNMDVYGAGRDRMDLLIPEACRLVDDSVNFADYDSNNDGYVDLVYIIYAGLSESISGNPSTCIWPKSGAQNFGSFDGKTVYRYGVNNELAGTVATKNKYINGIGLFCHEFSHCLGLPDLYATSGSSGYNQDNQGMEFWSLMDGGEYVSNGRCPTAYTAWEREVMGWFSIDTLSDTTHVDMTTIDDGGKAYKILNDSDSTAREYVVLQNIQLRHWNQRLPGHGLFTYRINYQSDSVALFDFPNNELGKAQVLALCADGKLGSMASFTSANAYLKDLAGDPYPGTTGIDSIASFPMTNGMMLAKPVLNIEENGDTVSFDFLAAKKPVADYINKVVHNNNTDNRIFCLDGRYVGTDFTRLPKGIYVMNKKKIVKK